MKNSIFVGLAGSFLAASAVFASPAMAVGGWASINPTASALVCSAISVGVMGTGATASGSVSLSNQSGGSTTINGVIIPLPAGATAGTYAAIATPPLNQNFPVCNISVTIATAGTINTNASSGLFDWYADAYGGFNTATPGLRISPQVNCGEGETGDPIIIDHGP